MRTKTVPRCAQAAVAAVLALSFAAWGAPPPVQTVDPTANAPYPVLDATPAITQSPLVLDVSGTSAEIEWMTGAAADARVRYGSHALDHVAVPETDGLIPVGRVHRVIIRGLQPGHTYQYQAVSRRVVQLRPYWPEIGQSVRSQVHTFTTLSADKPSTSFAFFTDTHERLGRIAVMADSIHRDPVDFVVDGGDIVNWVQDGNQLREKFLDPVAKALGGTTPLLYVRGNHENRGPHARSLGKYLYAQDGHYYYTRDAGPLHLVVVDTGEDKPDATNVYAGLNDMHDYKRAERAWFAKVLADEPRTRTAPFTVVLAHQPDWGWSYGSGKPTAMAGANADWMKLANDAHIDLMIAGHVHRFEFIKPGAQGNDFPILVVGINQVARVKATDAVLSVTVTDKQGKVIKAFTLKRRAKP